LGIAFGGPRGGSAFEATDWWGEEKKFDSAHAFGEKELKKKDQLKTR